MAASTGWRRANVVAAASVKLACDEHAVARTMDEMAHSAGTGAEVSMVWKAHAQLLAAANTPKKQVGPHRPIVAFCAEGNTGHPGHPSPSAPSKAS